MQIWWVEAWERAPKSQAMGIYNHVTMYNRCSRCNLQSSPLDSQFQMQDRFGFICIMLPLEYRSCRILVAETMRLGNSRFPLQKVQA